MSTVKLQVALDCSDLTEAILLSRRVVPYVDILEVGTILLKSVGLEAVYRLSMMFPHKPLFADTKTMDAGAIEAEMVFRAGARMMSVCAAAPDPTIRRAIRKARQLGGQVVVDLIGVQTALARLASLKPLGPDYVCFHTGIDEQQAGIRRFDDLEDFRLGGVNDWGLKFV